MLMADDSRKGASHDFSRVSRKAEEAVLRRYQAVHWLQCLLGTPLGIPTQPTETDFISCLRNGIILCNAINKIQPGTIPKVVENHVSLESQSNVWDSRPLPAYQYFENVRNFLLAVAQLKLPAFEASDLERENIEAGSAARIADCILALKSYHEWKEWSGGNGVYKHVTVKSPLVMHFASENFSRSLQAEAAQPCRQLDFPPGGDKDSLTELIVKALSQDMVDSKENLNANLLTSLKKGNQQDAVQIFSEILSGCLEEKLRNRSSKLNMQETSGNASASHPQPISILQENLSFKTNPESSQSRKSSSDHWRILNNQKKDLTDIKALWTETKSEFEYLRNQLMKDLNDIGILVEEMSNHARGYQKVIQENRKLYNMVQDLKGNIRVCCRIRPMLNSEDGTIVVIDPTKLRSEDGKEYQFTRVYGPLATQDELYKDSQPLIRSVMDGYNVCILAYGQSRSGKSYTMYGPSGVSEKEMGLTFFALNDIFQTANMRKYTITYELHIQMVEICDEQVRDLLSEGSTQHDEASLSNVALHAVTKNTEAINLVKQGQIRCTGSNASEKTNLSNCSHSVVTIHVQGKDLSGKIFRSRLHLVDLAQSGKDDKSLSCLEDVIASLTQKKSYIHYKDSKLTALLQDALGGKAKILVFAHLVPEGDSFTKTVSTLKFARRISTIELGTAQSNKMNSEVMELKNEIENLKSALGDKVACSPQPTKQPKSPRDKARAPKSPVKSRRLSLENQSKNTLGDKRACSPDPTKQPKSPRDKARAPKSPVKSRRLSLENQSKNTLGDKRACSPDPAKQPKSPRDKARAPKSPVKSRRLSLENQSKSTLGDKRACSPEPGKQPKSPRDKERVIPQKSPEKYRRLSLENQSKSALGDKRACSPQPTKQPKSPRDKARAIPQRNPIKSRRLSLENEGKGTMPPPQTPLRVRRLSLEGPKDNLLTDSQTPGISKSAIGKGSQIKKSLRAIGKLINGSEKRNPQKVESTSAKSKDGRNGAKSPPSKITKSKDGRNGVKSPPSSKSSVSRRHSLTSLPPPGTIRRTSLGGLSTDSAKRWM